MSKTIKYGKDSRQAMLNGVDKLADAVKINAHAYMIVKKHIALHLLNLRENFLCESSLLCESFFCHNSVIYWLILREAQNLPF